MQLVGPSQGRGEVSAEAQLERERSARLAPSPERQTDRLRRPNDLEPAVERYAGAFDAADRTCGSVCPYPGAQRLEAGREARAVIFRPDAASS